MSIYPDNWPRCPKCGDHALDGHITCGRFECDEHETRRENDEPAYWMWSGRKYYYDHPAADDDFRDEQ